MTIRTAQRLVRGVNGSSDGTDAEPLGRFAESGDEAAFAAVFNRHAGMVLGVCKRALADPRDAEDACQATFLVLARKARTGRWHTSVANWLHETARRVARNVRVTAARRVRREVAAAVPEAVPAVDRMSARELLEALDEELARLPARYREPLVLCHLEGLTRDQAARRLGLRPGTVKIRLERGRRRLAAALTARGTTPGAVLLATAVTSAASAEVPRLTEPTLAAVGGRPSAAVAALADGVSSTGTVLGLAGFAFGVVVITLGLLFGLVNGRGPVSDPPKKSEPTAPVAAATDAFGDPLPDGAVARLGTVRFRFGMWPRAVAPSPDGSKFAMFGANSNHVESMTISDATSGRPLRSVALVGARVQSAQWLPDGRGFAVLQTDTTDYAVWEFTDEKAAPPAYTGMKEVRAITNGIFVTSAVSPDGKLVAGASQAGDQGTAGRLEVWTLVPGGKVRAAAARHTIDMPDGFVWLGFTPDSKRLVGITRQREPNQPGAALPGGPIPVVPGARADTAQAIVWDAATGKELLSIKTPGGQQGSYTIAPDGATLFAAGEKGRVAAFDLATGKERFAVDVMPQKKKDNPARPLSHLVVAAGGRTLLVVEPMQAVAALDAVTGKLLWRNTGREAKQVDALAALPDGKRFAIGCVDGTIVVGDATTGEILDPGPGHRGWVYGVALDSDGRGAVTSGSDGTLRRWNLASGRETGKVEGSGFVSFRAHAFSPDHRTVVGSDWQGNTGSVVLVDVATGRTLRRVKGATHHLFVSTMFGGRPAAWMPDGSVILTDADCGVRFGPDGKEIRTYTTKELEDGSAAYSAVVSPDGKRVALVGRGPLARQPTAGWVAVFDAVTGVLIRSTKTSQALTSAAFTPDGSILVSGWVYPQLSPPDALPFEESTATAIGLFDPTDGKMHHPFADPTDGTAYRQAAVLAVSPAGHQFAVAENDNSITVYERASGAVRRRFRGHVNQVYQLAFTPDGSRLVSVSWDGTGLVWDVTPPRPTTPPAVTDAERLKRWDGLLSTDGPTAYRTMGELAADSAGTVSLLKAKLDPKPPTDAEIDKSIDGLGGETFADREAAAGRLEQFGAAAVPRVKARLKSAESAEVCRRLGEFLTKYDRPDRLIGPRLRERRAIELLEVMATADARTLLDELARSGSSPLAQDAATAAGRLRTK